MGMCCWPNWQRRLQPPSFMAHAGQISTSGTGQNRSAGTMPANGRFPRVPSRKRSFRFRPHRVGFATENPRRTRCRRCRPNRSSFRRRAGFGAKTVETSLPSEAHSPSLPSPPSGCRRPSSPRRSRPGVRSTAKGDRCAHRSGRCQCRRPRCPCRHGRGRCAPLAWS